VASCVGRSRATLATSLPVRRGHEKPTQGASGRRTEHHHGKRCAPDQLEQVRRGLAHREGSHHGPDGHPAGASEPGGDHLHGRRIHSRQKEPREEPADESDGISGRNHQGGIGQSCQQSRQREVPAGRDDVGEIQQRSRCGSRNEPELDQRGEPPDLAGTQPPTLLQHRRGGTGCEPSGHTQEYSHRNEGQHAPAAPIGIARQRHTIFRITNQRFAGLSARRLIYQGNQAAP